MPRGVYDNKKTALERLIEAEWSNLSNCRKNHSREQWNEKVDQLRAIMSALGHVLAKEAELGHEGGAVEKHSYDTKISGVVNNHDYVEAVKAFIKAWAGVESQGAEALLDEARELVDEAESLVQFMEMEDLMIANIPNQDSLRIPTDDFVENIIKKAEVEHFELSPDSESEKERLEIIDEFLAFVKNWLKRITVSVKNSGKEQNDPKPEPPVEPLLVHIKKVDSLPIYDDCRELTEEEEAAYDQAVEDGLYEVYP